MARHRARGLKRDGGAPLSLSVSELHAGLGGTVGLKKLNEVFALRGLRFRGRTRAHTRKMKNPPGLDITRT